MTDDEPVGAGNTSPLVTVSVGRRFVPTSRLCEVLLGPANQTIRVDRAGPEIGRAAIAARVGLRVVGLDELPVRAPLEPPTTR